MFFDTKGTFKINKTIREPYFNMQKEHHHNAHEIYYLVSGTRKFFLNDSIYIVNKGDLIIIPKGAIHKSTYISNLTHERLYIYFSDEYLKDLIDEYGKKIISKFFLFPHITLSLEEKIYIENLFLKIQNEYIKKDLFSNTLLKIYIKELIIQLIRYQKNCKNTISNIDTTDKLMQKAAKYICKNYKKKLTLTTVAKLTNLSNTYFSMKFKQSTGFGFKEYLLKIRIKKASELLIESNLSITEISFLCGFSDSNYFGDVFKKAKGLSPLNYKNRHHFEIFDYTLNV